MHASILYEVEGRKKKKKTKKKFERLTSIYLINNLFF